MSFESGKSGNPQGRPVGVPDKRTKLRSLLQIHAQELIQKAVELALAGDVNALRLCLERLIPRLRSEPAAFLLPFNDVKNVKELLDNNAAVIAAVSCGELTLEQAQTLSSLLEAQHKFIVGSELEQRLAAIEMALKERRNNEKY
jgi:hypothetical protein